MYIRPPKINSEKKERRGRYREWICWILGLDISKEFIWFSLIIVFRFICLQVCFPREKWHFRQKWVSVSVMCHVFLYISYQKQGKEKLMWKIRKTSFAAIPYFPKISYCYRHNSEVTPWVWVQLLNKIWYHSHDSFLITWLWGRRGYPDLMQLVLKGRQSIREIIPLAWKEKWITMFEWAYEGGASRSWDWPPADSQSERQGLQ